MKKIALKFNGKKLVVGRSRVKKRKTVRKKHVVRRKKVVRRRKRVSPIGTTLGDLRLAQQRMQRAISSGGRFNLDAPVDIRQVRNELIDAMCDDLQKRKQ